MSVVSLAAPRGFSAVATHQDRVWGPGNGERFVHSLGRSDSVGLGRDPGICSLGELSGWS